MAQHAKLSPSAAHRWMNCPGSVALIGDESSVAGPAAMLGTAAHRVIEVMGENKETDASKYLGFTAFVHIAGQQETRLAKIKKPQPMDGWWTCTVDQKMVDGVQMFIDEVERLKGEMYAPEEINERFLDMTWLDDRLGGTADKTLVEPFGWAHLLDYKNGYGVVEVTDNDQFKNYAVGILHEHPDAEGVRCSVVQPNAPHAEGAIRTEEYTRDELKLYEIQLKEAADATSKPNAKRRAGDWCMFCPAKLRCPEFENRMYEEAGADFRDEPPTRTEFLDRGNGDVGEQEVPVELEVPKENDGNTEAYLADLGRKAKWIPLVDKWAREIEGAIQIELMNGRAVPGQKLVQGRSNRKWLPEASGALEQRVNKEIPGFPLVNLWTEPELKSPAQVEKLGDKETKKALKAIVAELAAAPPGKLTVADEHDPRPAVSPEDMALADFAGDPVDDFT